MPTLTQLEYLVAVDRHRHFGKAAKACHVSQPTLSMQLRKFEDEYGFAFFDREVQPILPTKEGALLIEQAKVVLREAGKLDYIGRHHEGRPMGEFKLALIPTLAPYLLPLFLAQFAKRYPEVKLQVDEMTTEQIIEALEEDRLDAGILATPLGRAKLVEVPLFYEPFWVFAHKGHQLAKFKTIDEDKLDGHDIWLLTEGHCLRNQITRLCSLRGRHGLFANVELEGGSLSTLIHLVEHGLGYTILPALATGSAGLSKLGVLRPFGNPTPSREVSLVSRRTQFKQQILEALAREIVDSLPQDIPIEKSKSIQVIKI